MASFHAERRLLHNSVASMLICSFRDLSVTQSDEPRDSAALSVDAAHILHELIRAAAVGRAPTPRLTLLPQPDTVTRASKPSSSKLCLRHLEVPRPSEPGAAPLGRSLWNRGSRARHRGLPRPPKEPAAPKDLMEFRRSWPPGASTGRVSTAPPIRPAASGRLDPLNHIHPPVWCNGW